MASSARIDELRKKFDENPRRYFAPLANEYRKAGDLEQAVFICQEYLPQQPGHMSGHIVYGQTLFEMGRHEESRAVFETALSLDPENLIALRHLGDIARMTGDSNGARIWYQRVLEADPRNEEIAQLMIALLAAPEPPTAADAPAVVPMRPVAATPASTSPVSGGPPAVADAGAAFVVEKSHEDLSLRTAAAEPFEPALPAHTTSGTKAGDGHDFLSLDDFDIGGATAAPRATSQPIQLDSAADAEPTADSKPDAPDEPFEALSIVEAFRPPPADEEVASEPPAPTEIAAEPMLEVMGSADREALEGSIFELGSEDGPFEADPYAVARNTEAPPVEPATDLNLGLVDAAAISHEMPEAKRDLEPPVVTGLQSFEPGVIADADAPVEVPAFDTEPFFDTATTEPTAIETPAVERPAADDSFSNDEAAPPLEAQQTAPVQAFVTETMAELYLRQGHVDSALEIYRQLVDQRPDDADLADRLRAVEDQVYGSRTPAEDTTSAPVYGGPTIREFLRGLAASRTPLPVDTVPDRAYEPAFEDEGPLAPLPEATRAPHSDETVRGSIDALFSEADAASTDVTAASALREAFAPEGPETAPLRGMPAHRASSELSLDHVFKGNSPPPADGDGFSFDQFFAEEMSEGASNASTEGGAPTEATDDIAQFNAWLNGLKKT